MNLPTFGLLPPVITAEHTESYYAATAAVETYPRLEGEHSADVVVVGGGFSGVNTALELAERGFDVVLLEAHRIGWGASGRNGGQLIGGLGQNPGSFRKTVGNDGVALMHALGVECVDIVRERIQRYAIDCELVWGYCNVALKRRHLRELNAMVTEAVRTGYPHKLRLLDNSEVKEFVCSEAYCGGLYNAEGGGHLHPLKLCQGEARAASGLGVRIFEHSPVLGIEYSRRPRVTTSAGGVSARKLVLCGNAYLDDLEPAIARYITPASTCMVATEPLSPELAQSLLPTNAAICDLRTALDYYRLSSDGRLLFGGLSNYTGLLPDNYENVLLKKMLRLFPQLEDVRIDYAWDGQMGISMNRMPQTGRIGNKCFYIQAFSGHGVAPTHALARLVAEAIAGDCSRFNVMASVRHRRFPGGPHFKRPAMALGMLYYKALDYL